MGGVAENKDGCSLEFWRQRLVAFRIDPSRLSYANDRKFEARGGHGYVRKATLLPPTQIQRGSGHHESHGRESTAPKTDVAVKSLHARGDIDSERFEKRFIREAYIWSQLQHKNILEFLGFHFSSSDGEVEALLVCPWFDNGQSTEYLRQHPLSPMGRLQLVLDAAEGLHYLHSRDPPICHGDVKGSNLLIKNDGRAALSDFGSAHELDEMFQEIVSETTQRGTVRWASPERLDSDDPPTPSSDVWSWGWLTREIMTGKVPFDHLTGACAVIYNIVASKLPSCEKEAGFADLPHLSLLVWRCWQSAPDSRPRIRDVITDLKRILEPNESHGEHVHASPVPLKNPLLGNNTQRNHQFRLSQSAKSTLGGATVDIHALSRPEETLGKSPPFERSIRVTDTSKSIRPTAEANNKWLTYPPGPGKGSLIPLSSLNDPVFPPASLFLSTSKPLDATSHTQSPGGLNDAVYLGDLKNKQSGTHVPVSYSLRNPVGEDQRSSLLLSGPGEAGSGIGRDAFAGALGSSTLGSRNLKRPFQSLEPSVIAPLPKRSRLSGEGVVEGESNERLSNLRSAARPTHLSARAPSFDPDKAIYTEYDDYSQLQPPHLRTQQHPTSNSTISDPNLGSVDWSSEIYGVAHSRCGTSRNSLLPAPDFETQRYYVPSPPPATLSPAQAISAPYSAPTTLPYHYAPHDAPASISLQLPESYASYQFGAMSPQPQASRAPSTTSINPPQPQAYHAPSSSPAALIQLQAHGAPFFPSNSSRQSQVVRAPPSLPDTWSYHSAAHDPPSSIPSQFPNYYPSYPPPTMSPQPQASWAPSTAPILSSQPHVPSPPPGLLIQPAEDSAASPLSTIPLQSQANRAPYLPSHPRLYHHALPDTEYNVSYAPRTLSPQPQAMALGSSGRTHSLPPPPTEQRQQTSRIFELQLSMAPVPRNSPRVEFASFKKLGRQAPTKQTVTQAGLNGAVCFSSQPSGLGRVSSQSVDVVVDGTSIPLVSVAEIKLFSKSTEEGSNTTQKGIFKATGRLVAVKSLPSFAERALEDNTWFKLCLSLKHPRIAELLGCMLSDSSPTVITVWYPNEDIVNFLKVAPLAERKPMLRQIAEGLSFLHNQSPRIIHSNLKPSNILIDDEGNVKLTDVGILRFLEMNEVQAEVPGKPEDIRWTAPEVLEGRRRDISSDIYAFGCVALMILKNRVPYASLQSDTAVARAVAKGEMPIDSGEAAKLHEVWRNCLARKPVRRVRTRHIEASVGAW